MSRTWSRSQFSAEFSAGRWKWVLNESTGTWSLRNPVNSVADPWHFCTDPYLWLMDPDPDPAIFSVTFKMPKPNYFSELFCNYIFKLQLHNFSKIKVTKKSQNSRNQGFSYYFWLMIEGSGSRSKKTYGCNTAVTWTIDWILCVILIRSSYNQMRSFWNKSSNNRLNYSFLSGCSNWGLGVAVVSMPACRKVRFPAGHPWGILRKVMKTDGSSVD